MKKLNVKCPICKKKINWTSENPFLPFCSKFCKDTDLINWANGIYLKLDKKTAE